MEGRFLGKGSRLGAPDPEFDPHGSSRRKDPEPPEDKPESERVCRRGSPVGGGMDVEQKEDDDDARRQPAGVAKFVLQPPSGQPQLGRVERRAVAPRLQGGVQNLAQAAAARHYLKPPWSSKAR